MRLLRRKEVEALCGISCSALYRKMRAGEFPEPLAVGPHSVRWRSDEVESWIESRERATGEV